MSVKIGIDEKERKEIVVGLSRLLADTYTIYTKTQNYHWNVTGPMFPNLHILFQTLYTELAVAVDLIAERIRALGEKSPGSFTEFTKLAAVAEETGTPNSRRMIQNIIDDQEIIIKTARDAFVLTEKNTDQATADLLSQRIQSHEKTAWMLRSLLED